MIIKLGRKRFLLKTVSKSIFHKTSETSLITSFDTVPLLDDSIDMYRIWILVGKSAQKIVKEVATLKIDRLKGTVAPVAPALTRPQDPEYRYQLNIS